METKSRQTALEIAIDVMCLPITKLLIENKASTRFSKSNTTKYNGLLEMLRLGMVQDFPKCYERTSRIMNKIWFSVFVWLILLCGFLFLLF